VLTNLIQPETAASTANPSGFSFASAGQAASSFASTLQSAAKNDLPAPLGLHAEATAIAGQVKTPEKDQGTNTKVPAARHVTPEQPPAATTDTPPSAVTLVNVPLALPPDAARSIAAPVSIQPTDVGSPSDDPRGLVAGARPSTQDDLSGLTSEFQKDTLRHDPGPVPSSSLASAKRGVTLSAGVARSVFASSEIAALNRTDGDNVVGQEFVGTAEQTAALTPAQAVSAPNSARLQTPNPTSIAASPAGNAGPSAAEIKAPSGNVDLDSIVGAPIQSAMPLQATNSATAIANAPSAVDQAAADSQSQSGNLNISQTPTANVVATLPHPANALGPSDASTPGAKSAADKVDLRPLPLTLALPDTLTPTSTRANSPPNASVGARQPAPDNKTQSNNGPGVESLDAAIPSSTLSSLSLSAELSKPNSLHAGTAIRTAAGTPSTTNGVSQTPAERVPASEEHPASKPSDALSTPSTANAQPALPDANSIVTAAQPNGGQFGSAVVGANILAPAVSGANQESTTRNTTASTAEPAAACAAPVPTPAVGTVEVARLIAGAAQSEMHIGLRTQAFGTVDVHTVVRDSQVGVTVGSERGDLRTLLGPEVSGLQSAFRQQDLRFDNIRFLETNSGTTAGFSGGADSQSRSSNQQHSSAAEVFSIHSPPEEATETDVSAGSRTGLNVHA